MKMTDLEKIERLMIKYGVSIRAIPEVSEMIVETRHMDQYPNGKIIFLQEFGREMLIVQKHHKFGGKFVMQSKCGSQSIVRFNTDKVYGSIEEILEELLKLEVENEH